MATRQMLADAASYPRHDADQMCHAMRLAMLAKLFPVRVIFVLQPSRDIAADRLQVRGRILRVPHVLISRRHGERRETADGLLVPDPPAPGIVVDVSPAVAPAPDHQLVAVRQSKPKLPRQPCRR